MSQIRFQNNVTDLIGGIVAFLSFLISFISHPPTDFAKVSRVDFVYCYSSLLLLLLSLNRLLGAWKRKYNDRVDSYRHPFQSTKIIQEGGGKSLKRSDRHHRIRFIFCKRSQFQKQNNTNGGHQKIEKLQCRIIIICDWRVLGLWIVGSAAPVVEKEKNQMNEDDDGEIVLPVSSDVLAAAAAAWNESSIRN